MSASGESAAALSAHVDGIVVINLDRRRERWEAFQHIWRHHLPMDRVHRLSAVDGQTLAGFGEKPWFRGKRRDASWAGRGGCALSHRAAVAQGLEAGWGRFLVMEDDAVPTGDYDALGDMIARADGGLFYLGCREMRGPLVSAAPGLLRIDGALDAHAYIIDRKTAQWMAGRIPGEGGIWPWLAQHRAVDRWMRRTLGARTVVMAANPPLVLQGGGASDITHRDEAAATGSAPPPPRISDRFRATTNCLEAAYDRLRAPIKRWRGF